ncbi:MAG: TIGR03087 family PEP-CTERM/XrtA system glycosyltransferase [Sphingomonadaceae bacterium]
MIELLYLTHRIPYPPNKGDKIRAFHILDYLRQHARVHLASFIDDASDWQHVATLQAMCASTCFLPLRPALARLRSVSGWWRAEPLSVGYYRDAQMQQWVEQTLARHPIDTALAYSGPIAQYLPARTARGPLHRVMDFVDVDSAKWRDYATSQPWPWSRLYQREAVRLAEYEAAVARRFDRVSLVSAAEAALFCQHAPDSAHKTAHFSNGVDAEYFCPDVQRASPFPASQVPLVFTGAMDYWPNVQAVHWFCDHVLPAVRLQHPAVAFHIIGARPTGPVQSLAKRPGVYVSGTVADIRPYLQHAAVAVAPLRIARGIQNKVLEAMAMARPVIASAQALEGIDARIGHELLGAADAGEFIHHINDLLSTGENGLGPAARARIVGSYNWQRNLAHVGALLGLPATVGPIP